MALNALMQNGVAIMRQGGAVGRSASSACCCGASCNCGSGQGCYQNPNLEAFDSYWTPGTPNNPVRHDRYRQFVNCCCRDTQRFTGHAVRHQYQNRSITDPTSEECFEIIDTFDWDFIGRNGNVTWRRQSFDHCSQISDDTQQFPYGNPCWPSVPLDFSLSGGFYSGWARLNCQLFEGDTYGFPALPTLAPYLATWVHFQWRATIEGDPSPCQSAECLLGACCTPAGGCFGATLEECLAAGGAFRGPGTRCESQDCANQRVQGACCLPNGTCSLTSRTSCESAGGTYRGDGTTCATANCPPPPTGVCCIPPDQCQILTHVQCDQAGGTWFPTGDCSQCNPIITGACCYADGHCEDGGTAVLCMANGGTWQGGGSTCATVQCPQPSPGACCYININDITCIQTTAADCASRFGGDYHGDNTTCGLFSCTGKCCTFIEGLTYCTETTQRHCTEGGGVFFGFGTFCTGSTCSETTPGMIGVRGFINQVLGAGAFL